MFVCTYPSKMGRDPLTRQATHPQPWQFRVQAGLRCQRPPLVGQRMFVGYDEEGLAAVGMYEPRPTDESFYIRAVARAQRLAHKRVADEILTHLVDQITRELEYVDAGFREIFCEIHWKNTASKNLFRRAGFECIGHDDDSGLETWGIDLGDEQVDFAVVDD